MNGRAEAIVKRILIGSCLVAIGLLSLQLLLSPWYLVGFNIDDSLPGRAYLVLRGELPARNERVAFRAPANPYYPEGAPFIKILRGLPGDEISRIGRTVFIEGEPIGRVKERTRDHRPLTPGPTGTLPAGRYFVWTPHPDSYDSRYAEIGWISQDRILGRALRLL